MVYYRYKKERLSEKFNSAHEFLIKIRKAVQLYCLDPNEIIARGMTGYFSDFTEYIIDICETYLVINDRYNPRLSGVDLIKSATREGLMDDYLCEFLIKCIIWVTSKLVGISTNSLTTSTKLLWLCTSSSRTVDCQLVV